MFTCTCAALELWHTNLELTNMETPMDPISANVAANWSISIFMQNTKRYVKFTQTPQYMITCTN